jgi:hypothetical protein
MSNVIQRFDSSMIRLTYVSTCAPNLALADVQAICNLASARNQQLHICGMLFWSGEFFLQTLEGDRDLVTQLFQRISADPRHLKIELIATQSIHKRRYAEWGMGFTKLLASHRVQLVGASTAQRSFNPYLLESSELEEALYQIAQSQRVIAPSHINKDVAA